MCEWVWPNGQWRQYTRVDGDDAQRFVLADGDVIEIIPDQIYWIRAETVKDGKPTGFWRLFWLRNKELRGVAELPSSVEHVV